LVMKNLRGDSTAERDAAALVRVMDSRAERTRSYFDSVGPEWDAVRKVFNDDALRAIDLYCTAVANACVEGDAQHQAALVAQRAKTPAPRKSGSAPTTGRRVVEIKQTPRRSRGGAPSVGGGKAYTAGGDAKVESSAKPAAKAPEAPEPKAAAPVKPTAASEPAAAPGLAAAPGTVAAPAADEAKKTE